VTESYLDTEYETNQEENGVKSNDQDVRIKKNDANLNDSSQYTYNLSYPSYTPPISKQH
jgi:hypothetical protein